MPCVQTLRVCLRHSLLCLQDNAVDPNERKTSTVTVTITIADSDDLNPTFYHPGCRDTSTLANSCDGVTYRASITSGVRVCVFKKIVHFYSACLTQN
jgi:hypothetical protein